MQGRVLVRDWGRDRALGPVPGETLRQVLLQPHSGSWDLLLVCFPLLNKEKLERGRGNCINYSSILQQNAN